MASSCAPDGNTSIPSSLDTLLSRAVSGLGAEGDGFNHLMLYLQQTHRYFTSASLPSFACIFIPHGQSCSVPGSDSARGVPRWGARETAHQYSQGKGHCHSKDTFLQRKCLIFHLHHPFGVRQDGTVCWCWKLHFPCRPSVNIPSTSHGHTCVTHWPLFLDMPKEKNTNHLAANQSTSEIA